MLNTPVLQACIYAIKQPSPGQSTAVQPQCYCHHAQETCEAFRYLLFRPANLAVLHGLWPVPLCSMRSAKLG